MIQTDTKADDKAGRRCPNCGADVTSENPAYLFKVGVRCEVCLEADDQRRQP